MAQPELISHWNQLIDGLEHSSDSFYKTFEAKLAERKMPGVKVDRTDFAEGGLFSARRTYLRIRRDELTYHICAAPFGEKYFFFSAWLHGNTGCLATLASIPGLGLLIRILLRPLTFYYIDSTMMFQSAVHTLLMTEIDELTKAQNLQPLSAEQRKPILSEFYAKPKR